MQKQEQFIRCSDMALIATLALYYPIESVDKTNPRKAQFLFCRNADLDQMVEQYWRGELSVEPQQFVNQLRIVKSRLYGDE